MLNKVVVIASGKTNNSVTEEMVKLFFSSMSIYDSLDITYINLKTKNITPCKGCENCFINGECTIHNDDMNQLKKILLNSHIIMIATPVYLRHIPGDLKIFIDRIAYWAHLFRLSGKIGQILITTSNSGVSEVSKYLKLVFNYLGVVCMGGSYYSRENQDYQNIIDAAHNFESYLQNSTSVVATDEMNFYFTAFKNLIKDYPQNSYEYQYWKNNGMFNMEHIQEKIDKSLIT